VWRLVLVTLVAGLAVINATGVYTQLVSAHVGARGAAAVLQETQDAAHLGRIDVRPVLPQCNISRFNTLFSRK
jgi:hypothetical protein